MWIWAERHSWKKPGDTHQFLAFIYSSHFFLYLKYPVLFFLGEFNLSLPSSPVPFVLFFVPSPPQAADFEQAQRTWGFEDLERVEITPMCILTVKWPHFDGQHFLMLIQEEHVSCSWGPGTMTVSDITSHFLWSYCKHPLLPTTNLLNHSPKSIFFSFFYFFLSPFQPPHLFILIVRYPPSLIFSQKPFKRRKLTEKEDSFHLLSKNHHFVSPACFPSIPSQSALSI